MNVFEASVAVFFITDLCNLPDFFFFCEISYTIFYSIFSDKTNNNADLYQVTHTPPLMPKRLANHDRGTTTTDSYYTLWTLAVRVGLN